MSTTRIAHEDWIVDELKAGRIVRLECSDRPALEGWVRWAEAAGYGFRWLRPDDPRTVRRAGWRIEIIP